jgi:hypothetical protein
MRVLMVLTKAVGVLRTRTRTFTATDACGNTATISRSVTWTADITPPTFTGSYATIALGCNPSNISATLSSATATDGCGTPTVNAVLMALIKAVVVYEQEQEHSRLPMLAVILQPYPDL